MKDGQPRKERCRTSKGRVTSEPRVRVGERPNGLQNVGRAELASRCC